jgi:hypothetical protein
LKKKNNSPILGTPFGIMPFITHWKKRIILQFFFLLFCCWGGPHEHITPKTIIVKVNYNYPKKPKKRLGSECPTPQPGCWWPTKHNTTRNHECQKKRKDELVKEMT